MKRILLSAGILISLSAAAQDNNLVENYFNRQLKSKRAVTEPLVFKDYFNSKQAEMSILPQQTTSLTGEKVIYLPQDGMACIQPDLSQFNMPNAGAEIQMKRSGPGVIPNPGHKPVTVLPRGKTTLMKKP